MTHRLNTKARTRQSIIQFRVKLSALSVQVVTRNTLLFR